MKRYKHRYLLYWDEKTNCIGHFYDLLLYLKEVDKNKIKHRIVKEMINCGYITAKRLFRKTNLDLILIDINRTEDLYDYYVYETNIEL